MTSEQRRASICQAFQSQFGGAPAVWVRAPGRVDLMGSHTDYNEGFVLTLSIDRDTWIAGRSRQDTTVNITSLNLGESDSFDARQPLQHDRIDGWGVYFQGVVQVLQEAGYRSGGLDAVVHGTVPIGSGLSSSASLEAAVATLLEQLGHFQIELVRKAQLCQRAENQIVGVNCGILDQYSSVLGQQDAALLLDCRHLSHRYVDFPRQLRVVICNTCFPRQLADSAYGQRRAHCEQGAAHFARHYPGVTALRDVSPEQFDQHECELDATVAKRCRFIIEENQRVLQLSAALPQDDRRTIGVLTAASYAGACELFEITNAAMQAMMQAMRSAPGVVGARQAGAGFGGCLVAFVETGKVDDFIAHTERAYQQATDIRPEIYPVRAAAGAGRL